MKSVLSALWQGNLRPSEQFMFRDPENKKLIEEWTRLRRELDSRITDEKTRELLHRLETLEMNLSEASELAAFRAGYTIGVAMTEEVSRERVSMGV